MLKACWLPGVLVVEIARGQVVGRQGRQISQRSPLGEVVRSPLGQGGSQHVQDGLQKAEGALMATCHSRCWKGYGMGVCMQWQGGFLVCALCDVRTRGVKRLIWVPKIQLSGI